MTLTSQAPDNVTKGRSQYVGGSDVPVILGLSKFKNQYQLALEKAGIVKAEFTGNEYTEFGNAMEPRIREYINLTTDYHFVETTSTDNDKSIRSNTDGVDHDKKMLLEIKTHGKTPTYQIYNAQMQMYMYQNDLDNGLLALYERPDDFDIEFDSERLQLNNVVRNDQFINEILQEIALFWQRVEWLKKNEGASEHDYINCLESDGEMATTELAVKTVKMTKPEIEFNYDELANNLKGNLKKYDGLTFTEATAKDCRATITELNKGKKLVDDYRKKVKKQLSEPIKKFETDCKKLDAMFNETIAPLKEQSDAFEEKRKEEKEKGVNKLVMQLIEDHGYDVDFQQLIEFDPKWLNKSTSMKTIEQDITDQIEAIKLQIEKEEMHKQLIKSHVELMNAKHNVVLLETAYVHLAGNKDNDEIKSLIEQDAALLVERKREEKEVEPEPHHPIVEETFKDLFDGENEETGELFIDVYKVTGTVTQLDALEEYMSSQGLTWEVVEE